MECQSFASLGRQANPVPRSVTSTVLADGQVQDLRDTITLAGPPFSLNSLFSC